MYRTEKLYEKLKDQPLKYPVCVPSYSRPNNALIEWVKKPGWNIPKNKLVFFIRNTPEQREMYKPLQKYARIVLIPASTKDLGETRMHIVNWGIKHHHEVLFMLDDRVNGIWWLNKVVRNGKLYLDVDTQSTPADAFKIWAHQHRKHKMLLTGIGNKGFHWMPNLINFPIEPLNGGFPSVAVAVSPLEFAKRGINYSSIDERGIEDSNILYQLLIRKLPFCMLYDLCYDQTKPCSVGGGSAVYQTLDRNERLTRIKKVFWENTLGIPWGEKHPGFRLVQRSNESNRIQINYPYWRNYYANSE